MLVSNRSIFFFHFSFRTNSLSLTKRAFIRYVTEVCQQCLLLFRFHSMEAIKITRLKLSNSIEQWQWNGPSAIISWDYKNGRGKNYIDFQYPDTDVLVNLQTFSRKNSGDFTDTSIPSIHSWISLLLSNEILSSQVKTLSSLQRFQSIEKSDVSFFFVSLKLFWEQQQNIVTEQLAAQWIFYVLWTLFNHQLTTTSKCLIKCT